MKSCLVSLAIAALIAHPALAQDDPEGLEHYLSQLLSDEPEVHAAALAAIVDLGEPAAPALEALAQNGTAHSRVRAGAVFALGRIGAEGSVTVLENLWESGFESLGGALAIQTAVALAEYDDVGPLQAIVGTGDEVLGAKAAVQLGLRGSSESLELLQTAYEDPENARMRPFYAVALGLLGDGRGEEILRAGIRTPELRNHSAVALARLGHSAEVVFELDFALGDLDPLVRLAALDALIALEPSRLAEILDEAAQDADGRVRELAARAEALQNRRRR